MILRFATEPYTNDPSQLNNRFIHLTNYSLNRLSDNFVHSEDPESAEGNKWTLSCLWKYLGEQGVDTATIWHKVTDIVIKTLLCGHAHLLKKSREQEASHYSGYRLLGCDIFLDSLHQPHLLEVNTMPNLNTEHAVDSHVKDALVAEMFNIVGFHFPLNCDTKYSASPEFSVYEVHDWRLYSKDKDLVDLTKQAAFTGLAREEYLGSIIKNLSPMDVRLLVHAEEELSQTRGFQRIWPSSSSHHYHMYSLNM